MVIVLTPFLNLILIMLSRFIGPKVCIIISILTVIVSFIDGIKKANEIFFDKKILLIKITWENFLNMELNFSFLLDSLSITMCILITSISTLVMLYSFGYLNNDPHVVRFISFLGFFCGAMLLLVASGNYLQLFIGWEVVGLASFLLISFWVTKNSANQGGLKAVLINRIGDIFFIIALGILYINVKSFNFSHVTLQFIELDEPLILNISCNICLVFCLLIAAIAKSAQIFFHTWLVDAMEGPTPVSSLLHSATMVTAGIFLIIRSSSIFSFAEINNIIISLGLITACISGIIGLNQNDLKKIIAFSTCSQLGVMFIALGSKAFILALYHLIMHAFFKCNLFLCAGTLIHSLSDEQDLRRNGALVFFHPITFISILISSLSLAGFPFFSGYYSKDSILESLVFNENIIFFYLTIIAAFLTSSYSIRSINFIFFGSPTIEKKYIRNIEEAPIFMFVPVIILTILSIILGKLTSPFFTGPISYLFWKNSILDPILSPLTEPEYLGIIKLLPTMASILGITLSILLYSSGQFYNVFLNFYSFFNISSQKFYFDSIYNCIASSTLTFGYFQYKIIDRGFLELLGPTGIKFCTTYFYKFFTNSGFLHHYLMILIANIGLILFSIYYNPLLSMLGLIIFFYYQKNIKKH